MRRHEIDWVRNVSILILFIYHSAAIFCTFGDFYIISEKTNLLADLFILLMFVWYMPMLFFLAGASTYFASNKRTFREYLCERKNKLLIPLLFGIVFLVPPQTYLARIWRGEDNLNYFEHLKYFFTTVTDFSGYDGAFSPAHLWFILYLFIVSIIGGFIVFKLFKKEKGIHILNILKSTLFNKFSFIVLLTLGVVSDIFPNIMGKSIVGCLILFLLGYIVYSDTNILNKMIVNRFKFLYILFFTAFIGVMYTFLFRESISNNIVWIIDSVLKNVILICTINTITSFSSLYLNTNNSLLRYLNKSTFPVYIIHQPILLGLAFILVPLVKSTTLALLFITLISLVVTFLTYELIKKIKIFNAVLGLN